MGLHERERKQKTEQGLLAFDYELEGEVDEVTARGGLPLVLETWRALGCDEAVRQHVRIRQRERGYDEAEHTEALVLLQATGGECLEDLAILGADTGVLGLMGKEKLPSPEASRQFLLGFHDEGLLTEARQALAEGEKALVAPESEALQGLGRVVAHQVAQVQRLRPVTMATLEMDATIIESAKREAHVHYEGGRGYQPELVYWVEQDLVVADHFRDGNVPAGKQPLEVIRRGFAVVPETVKHRRFRADSACYEEETLKWLADERQGSERFTVSADMTTQLRRLCEAVKDWQLYEERANETAYMSEVEFSPGDWPKQAKPLRTLVLKIAKKQGVLFANGSDHKYLGIVSNDFDCEGAELIGWHYQKAGHIEVVHDVTKNEVGAGVLPCGAFGANAAWYRIVTLTYNVLSALKRLALPPKYANARPKRLRFAVFYIPARIVSHARRLYARIARALGEAADVIRARASLLACGVPVGPSG
jgi:hypothetical protein